MLVCLLRIRILVWPLIEWKASARRMGQDTMMRSKGAIGVILGKQGQAGGSVLPPRNCSGFW